MKREKQKKPQKIRRKKMLLWTAFVENLTRFVDSLPICCVLSTYAIESWILPCCSHEFNLNYVQGEKSQYLLYYNNIWGTNFQEQKRKLLRYIFVYHSLFHMFIHGCKFVIIETCSYIIAHDENVMSSLIIQMYFNTINQKPSGFCTTYSFKTALWEWKYNNEQKNTFEALKAFSFMLEKVSYFCFLEVKFSNVFLRCASWL